MESSDANESTSEADQGVDEIVPSPKPRITKASVDSQVQAAAHTPTPLPSATLLPSAPPLPTATPLPSPTPKTIPIKLVPYGYTLTDLGNGWNSGGLWLAIENLGDEPFYASEWGGSRTNSRGVVAFEMGTTTIETEEGVTYELDLDYVLEFRGPIPSVFRVKAVSFTSRSIEDEWAYLSWESATAATPPVSVSFERYPELSFDLPVFGTESPHDPKDNMPPIWTETVVEEDYYVKLIGPDFSTDNIYSTRSVTDLQGHVIELGSVTIEFTGKCGSGSEVGNEVYSNALTFVVNVTNSDQFYGADISEYMSAAPDLLTWFDPRGPYIVTTFDDWFLYGSEGHPEDRFVNEVGPGQTLPNLFLIGGSELIYPLPQPYIMINDQLYDLTTCGDGLRYE